MICIAKHVPNPHDGTAHYRINGPLAHLRKSLAQRESNPIDLQFQRLQEWSQGTTQFCDLALLQRPSTPQELEIVRLCKRVNVPVIVDYDDNLFAVPEDNGAHRNYMNKATQETIAQIIAMADCVWVSTPELKRTFQLPQHSLNPRVFVVPNALDEKHVVTGLRTKPQSKRNAAVLWRGSPTHERDVMSFAPEIAECAEKFPGAKFIFAGWNPWWLTERMQPMQAQISGPLPVGEFMDFVYNVGAHIGIVPLHDSRFNRCKSNISWLEMTWGGAVCLVPDWEGWRNPGCITYKNAEDFKIGLTALLSMSKGELENLNAMAWEHIENHYLLKHTNPIRFATIEALLGRREFPPGGEPYSVQTKEGVMELA